MKEDWFFSSNQSYTSFKLPFSPHWDIGGVFMIFLLSAIVGLICCVIWRFAGPAFFRGETLNRSTPTLVPEGAALPLAPAIAEAHGVEVEDDSDAGPA